MYQSRVYRKELSSNGLLPKEQVADHFSLSNCDIIVETNYEEIIDHRLSDREYICDAFSIADIAIFPWARAHRWGNIDVSDLVHLSRWFELMEAKDSVQKGIRVPSGKYPVAFSSVADLSEATRLNSEKYEA